MLIYLYDGTLDGLLTAVFESYYGPRKNPDRIDTPDHRQVGLTEEAVWIETDPGKAGRVMDGIRNRLSSETQEAVMRAWMTEGPEVGTVIHTFLRHAFKAGPRALHHEQNEAVSPLLKLSRATMRESHRMLGLARFMELESGIWYSRITPDYNILPLLAAHFAQRLGDQSWVIHDARRGLAAVYDRERWQIAEAPMPPALRLHPNEAAMQRYWQEYFRRIAIAERKNPRLQQQMMPKKYWKHLPEKQSL